MPKKEKPPSKYDKIITHIFLERYADGLTEIQFTRQDIAAAAQAVKVSQPKNLGDVVYAFRYRRAFPNVILQTQPDEKAWIIKGIGSARYCFRMVKASRIVVDPDLPLVDIPDSTPTLISTYSLSDEQALLAKVRYNRLIDIFLGITSHSLQNHLRTTVKDMGQIEIDEIYLGVDKDGRRYVVPVQAKVGKDQLGVVQTIQDIEFCQRDKKFKDLCCRSVSAQFMADQSIVLFELTLIDEDVVEVINERHYRLVSEIST